MSEIIIVDPGRGRTNKLSLLMAEYGFKYTQLPAEQTDYLDQSFKGRILKFW